MNYELLITNFEPHPSPHLLGTADERRYNGKLTTNWEQLTPNHEFLTSDKITPNLEFLIANYELNGMNFVLKSETG
jgi:hypothetical protein